jgi:predicted PilT family ATPase
MSAPISVLTLELEKMLEARIQSAQAERVALRDELDKLDAQLKKAITAIGKRPAHTDAELTELARQKEYQHRTTNMSLMKEKEFIRELEGIRQKKKDLIEYNKKQLDIEGLKGTRATTSAELREKEELLDELFAGSRKLSVANTLKCNPADVVEKKITIPEDNMPRIIGKGGSGVKLLEETFSVVILSERAHVLRIMGLEHSVSMAYTAILLKASSVTEALNLHAALKACLLVGKAALTKEIEDRFEVTLNYSKTDNICKIFGQSAGVAGAKESILAINFSKFRVKVDPAMIPRLVGKGGANLRSMYDESLLQIDLLKEENVVAIYGLHEHAAPVAAAIKSFLEDNKEVSHVLTVPHFFLHNCIQSIGAIQKRGAFIDCTFGKNEEDCTITVRGGSSAAGEALQAVKQVLNDFEANTSTIEFHQSSIASVIGRKGETINKLRTEYPDVMIQLNGSSVSVHSVNRVVREAAMEAIRLIADAHYSETVKLNKDATISLKQSVGEATRIKLMSELNLGVNIDTEGETVRLVGRVADVEAGKLLLAAFATSAFTIELQISAEDASSVGSMLNDLEGDFGVRASLTNKRQLLRIVGTKANSTKAKAALLAILDGAPGSGAVMVRIDPLDIPGLIGNKGRNLEALERQLGVRIDVVKSRESVRIRGALDILDQARAGLLLALSDNAKVTETVTASRDLGVEAVGRCLGEVARLYGMELVIRLSDRVFSIKGKKELVDAAKAFLIESMAGLASTSIPLFENHGSALPPSRFILLAERCGVSIRLDGDLNALQVTGSPACLRLAVDEVYLLLCALFPLMYEALPVPQFCFADLSAFHYVNTLEKDHSIGIHLDRFMSKVYLRGDATSIRDAVSALGGKVAAWEELHEVLEGLDEAAISALLAKQGELLSGFERDTGCSVRLSRSPRCLVIEGNSKEEVTAAKELIANRLSVPSDSILATTSSSWEVEIHPDVIGSIIGKGGAIIKKLRSDTGASIDYDQDNAIIKVGSNEFETHSLI